MEEHYDQNRMSTDKIWNTDPISKTTDWMAASNDFVFDPTTTTEGALVIEADGVKGPFF